MFDQIQCTVQRRLPAHCGQQRFRPFNSDDLFDHSPGNGLDIGCIGHFRVGHDGGGIGVHQNDAVALFTQGFASLHAGIIKLTSLADNNRTSADDENGFNVGTFGHAF